jgi:hypothetical protein
MKGTTMGADLYNKVKKALQILDIPGQKKLAGLVTDGAPSRP